ncbi:peptidoglycan editing factor PgeF [Caldichromatium japonicum]|uniref:Purine nucleoside phosphorylase n=1 Tax=Caldichromatium japonicum TaxID=2699430 RepID=A0A6G7VDG6_9GAMM|nr:peptidoglycan editing factor PgeF [Caldichromatium japonicum]QIK37898.1 peptidoglycan editing factor PgeF [Caldichromatium japonicum]
MEWLTPDWPAPAWVRACSTTRSGGVSLGPFASLNLSDRVGDDPERVVRNRTLLAERLSLPAAPLWLEQVHGCQVVTVWPDNGCPPADAALAVEPSRVCAVMTADCLPVLLCDDQGTRVAAVHAGWRGLTAGIIEQTVAALAVAPEHLLAWLGPAIGPDAFVVGDEVRALFIAGDPVASAAFRPTAGRWRADLWELARLRLERLGITRVYGGGACTFSQPERFFSYRRDGLTGRQASLIWLAPTD